MPCPFFEPQQIASSPQTFGVRFPLFDEYDGICHASAPPAAVDSSLRLRCCNHGYSRSLCGRLPASETESCNRFDVLGRTAESMNILYLEEQQHSPVHWSTVRYDVRTAALAPALQDVCVRAQVLAFCQSYLQHFLD